jgi:hypothetical protein
MGELQRQLTEHTGFKALIRSTSSYFSELFGDRYVCVPMALLAHLTNPCLRRLFSFWNQECVVLCAMRMTDAAFVEFADHLLSTDDPPGTQASLLLALLRCPLALSRAFRTVAHPISHTQGALAFGGRHHPRQGDGAAPRPRFRAAVDTPVPGAAVRAQCCRWLWLRVDAD